MARTPDYEGVISLKPKRRKKALTRLFSVTRKVPLNDNRFFVQMEICVPHPTIIAPIPAIFVYIQSSNGRVWFSLHSVADLQKLFVLNSQDAEAIDDALFQAQELADSYKSLNEEAVMATIRANKL